MMRDRASDAAPCRGLPQSRPTRTTLDIDSTRELCTSGTEHSSTRRGKADRPMTRAPITVSALAGVILGASCGASPAQPPVAPPPPAAAATTPTAPVHEMTPAEPAAPVATGQAHKAPIALEEYLNIRRIS